MSACLSTSTSAGSGRRGHSSEHHACLVAARGDAASLEVRRERVVGLARHVDRVNGRALYVEDALAVGRRDVSALARKGLVGRDVPIGNFFEAAWPAPSVSSQRSSDSSYVGFD